MSNFIDLKYIKLYSSNLSKFKDKGNNVFNFSCPECGDSKNKLRGYIYEKKNEYFYYCHNCNHSEKFSNYIKTRDYNLYQQYVIEKFGDKKEIRTPEEFALKEKPKYKIDLRSANSAPISSDVSKLLLKRRIPEQFWSKLYYTDNFQSWTNTLIPDKFKNAVKETRLIIPFIDKNDEFFGYQGRSLEADAKLRYISIMLDKEKPRIYGLNKVNFNRKHYVLEGPIDSMFLPNAIATAGGAILSELDKLGTQKENAVIVLDNEPRNENICNQINKAIIRRYKVFIWPDWVKSKDVNQFILEEGTIDNIKDIIDDHTFSGLSAELEFKSWRKS